MLNLHHLIAQPWAVTSEIAEHVEELLRAEGFAGLRRLAELRVTLGAVDPAERNRRQEERRDPEGLEAAARPGARSAGGGVGVAILPMVGMMTMRGDTVNCVPTSSSLQLAQDVRSLGGNSEVQAVVLEIDSPGGQVMGTPELAAAIRDVRAVKPVVSAVNGMAASAAYWTGAQADEIIVTPSGLAGSIGVYNIHVDRSKAMETQGEKPTLVYAGKYKVERNPFNALDDEARSDMQAEVDRAYGMFTLDVAKGRGVGVDAVRSGFGQGRLVGAKQAVDAGMANSVGTLDEAVRRAAQLARERGRAGKASSSVAALQLERLRRER